jgi:tetratricopeptide (TPR) repeat protein
MKTTLRVLALSTAVFALSLAAVPPLVAAPQKQLQPGSSKMDVPNLDRDPGLYFLYSEQAAAQGDPDEVIHYLRKALELDPTSAYLNTRVASMLFGARKVADALIMARNATLFDPQYEEAHSLLGKIYNIIGDRSRAIDAYSKALELKPDDTDLYVFIGSLQMAQKLHADAEKTFLKMIQQFPDEGEGYFYLGRVYIESKQYDKAADVFQSLIEKRPDTAPRIQVELGTIHALQKNYAQAEKHFREAIRLDTFNINARLSLAHALAAQKKDKESQEVFDELAKLAPANVSIQIRMALILAEQRQFDKATEILDKILQRKPGWDQVRFQLGQILREQGKTERAEEELVQIQKGQQTFVRSRILLSLMFLRLKEFSKAMRYIDEAISADTKEPELMNVKGSILEELYRYDEALRIYEQAIDIDPANTRLRYALGNVLEKSGRRSRSLAEMEKILAEKPDEASASNFIGYTLAVSDKDPEKAERLVRRAVELKPDDGYIADSLAYILHKQGKDDEALELLTKAVTKVKHDPIISEHLGDVLLAKGRKEEAAEAYRKSLSENPENLLVQEKLRKLEEEIGPKKH